MDGPPGGYPYGRFGKFSLTALADRLGVSPAVVVLGLLAVIAAALGGWWALRSPPGPDSAEILPRVGSVEIPITTTTAEAGRILVDVVGAVVTPGVHELLEGSRIVDAVTAAGGLKAEADRMRLNFAEPLQDGARLYVPTLDDEAGLEVVTRPRASSTGSVSGADEGAAGGSAPMDVNTATASQLERLPGVGPALAAAIVEHRGQRGPFASIDRLDDVSGIGPAKLEQIRPLVTAGGR
ncbi:MAG: ComEA family DNA-binding protein [Acidimicrobiaceae bacterium]|nr:ComEA family DNA-binding protein [Acidimicrobiaceae bacterium]